MIISEIQVGVLLMRLCREMSIGIYGSTGTPILHTLTTTRPLNLLYIDGQSAALTPWGTLDSQIALLQGAVVPDPDEYLI